MRHLYRVVTALAVSAYLAATFLPCEAPAGIGFRPSGVASSSHSAPHAESMAVETSWTPQTYDHAAHAIDRSTSHLVFTAPCVCGCGETRSTVGGGASRLGPAVVEISPVPFIALAAIRAPGIFPTRVSSPIRVIDPIPI